MDLIEQIKKYTDSKESHKVHIGYAIALDKNLKENLGQISESLAQTKLIENNPSLKVLVELVKTNRNTAELDDVVNLYGFLDEHPPLRIILKDWIAKNI